MSEDTQMRNSFEESALDRVQALESSNAALKAELDSQKVLRDEQFKALAIWKSRAAKLAELVMSKVAYKFTDPQGNLTELIAMAQEISNA